MTPEQLERRRKSREAWRERNPREWRRRRGSGGPAAGAPDSPPDTHELEALRAQVAALLANQIRLETELAELRAYRDRDRERSRRAYHRRKDSPVSPVTPVTSPVTRPAACPAPPSRGLVNTPPELRGYTAVSLTTTTTPPSPPTTGVVVVVDGSEYERSVWDAPDVRAALGRRPGLDLEILRGKVADWLREDPRRSLSVRTVLSFIERSSVEAPAPMVRTAGRSRVTHEVPDSPKYDAVLASMHEEQLAILARRRERLAAEAVAF